MGLMLPTTGFLQVQEYSVCRGCDENQVISLLASCFFVLCVALVVLLGSMRIFTRSLAIDIFVVIFLQTDVIVNSVGVDLNFGTGPLCKALLAKAGPALEAEFDKEIDREFADEGSVLCTSGCALACKSVLHAIVPLWDGLKGQTLEVHFNY